MVGFPLLLGEDYHFLVPSVCQVLAGGYFTYFILPHVHLLMRSPHCQYSISFLILVKFPELARFLPDPLLMAFDLGVQRIKLQRSRKRFSHILVAFSPLFQVVLLPVSRSGCRWLINPMCIWGFSDLLALLLTVFSNTLAFSHHPPPPWDYFFSLLLFLILFIR